MIAAADTGRVRLVSIAAKGLKARDFKYDVPDVFGIFGENATGKSTVLEAISLLSTGHAPGIPNTADGVMSLARGNRLALEGNVELPDRKLARIRRAWERDPQTKEVSQDIEIVIHDMTTDVRKPSKVTGKKSDKLAWIANVLGAMLPETWSLEDLIGDRGRGGGKLRSRLLRMLPRSEVSLQSLVPADAPDFTDPQYGEFTDPQDYPQFALDKTREQIRLREREIADLAREINDVGDTWTGEESPAAIEKSLETFRRELAGRGGREEAEKQVAAARHDLAKARSLAGAVYRASVLNFVKEITGAEIEWIRSEKKKDEGLRQNIGAELAEILPKLAGKRAKRDAAQSKLVQLGQSTPASQEDVEARAKELRDLENDQAKLQGRIEQLELETKPGHAHGGLSKCPGCNYDLDAHLEKERKAKEEDLEALKSEISTLTAAINETNAALTAAKNGVASVSLKAEIQTLDEEIAPLSARADELRKQIPAPLTWPDIEPAEFELRLIVAEEEERVASTANVGDLEQRLREAEERLAKSPGSKRTAAEIEADIRLAQSNLVKLVERNTRAKRLAEAEQRRAVVEQQIAELKIWEERFIAIQADLMKRNKVWVEQRLSDLLGGAKAIVELFNERGDPDCRFTVNGVYADTLNKGRKMTFLVALLAVLNGVSSAPWKPCFVDGIESVSLLYREQFCLALVEAQRQGKFSQVAIVGCPDRQPAVVGMTVIRLDDPDQSDSNEDSSEAA
jgi:hypothetical protein